MRIAEEPGVQIRKAPPKAIYDRYVIIPHHVFMLGSSMNTASARSASTVFMRRSPSMAGWVRAEHEGFWNGGTAI